jgi:transposase
MSNNQKKKQNKEEKIDFGVLSQINLHWAGLDVHAQEIWAAVPGDRDAEPVRKFNTYTPDLHQLANWLKQRGITTVAMESTGVYWIPIFQILEELGFEVALVNARYVKNVTKKGLVRLSMAAKITHLWSVTCLVSPR